MEQVDMERLGYLTLSLVGAGGSILMLPILFYLLRTPIHPLAIIQINKALITLVLLFMGITGYCTIKNSSLYAENHLSKNQIIKVVFIALSLGIIMRILCAEGGFPIIPTLLILMEITAQETISTSLFIKIINSLMGFHTDKHYCIPTGWINLTRYSTIAFLGVLVGLYIAQFINGKRLKKLLDIFSKAWEWTY